MEYKPNLTPEQMTDYFRRAKLEAAGNTLNAWNNFRSAQAAEKAIEDEETRLCGRRIPPERPPFRGDGTASPVSPIPEGNGEIQGLDALGTVPESNPAVYDSKRKR